MNNAIIGYYYDLYLEKKCSATDVFDKFRQMYLYSWKIDPCHYLSSLKLSWDAMLKKTNVELEFIKNFDMYFSIEKGMRGGVRYIVQN